MMYPFNDLIMKLNWFDIGSSNQKTIGGHEIENIFKSFPELHLEAVRVKHQFLDCAYVFDDLSKMLLSIFAPCFE